MVLKFSKKKKKKKTICEIQLKLCAFYTQAESNLSTQ